MLRYIRLQTEFNRTAYIYTKASQDIYKTSANTAVETCKFKVLKNVLKWSQVVAPLKEANSST